MYFFSAISAVISRTFLGSQNGVTKSLNFKKSVNLIFETIEILDLNKNDGSVKPSTAEKEVNKARAARQSADAAKAAADREIEAAEKSVSQSDKQPTGSIESEASKKSEPKEPPSDASN